MQFEGEKGVGLVGHRPVKPHSTGAPKPYVQWRSLFLCLGRLGFPTTQRRPFIFSSRLVAAIFSREIFTFFARIQTPFQCFTTLISSAMMDELGLAWSGPCFADTY